MTAYRMPGLDSALFTPAVERVRERAHALAVELREAAARLDETNAFSWDVYRTLGRAGLLAMLTPADTGRSPSALAYAVAAEELGRTSAALANLVQLTTTAAVFLARYASPDRATPLVARMAAGEALCGVAMTEAEAGSDASRVATEAAPDGAGYVLTGEKRFVTGALAASHAVVTARLTAGAQAGRVSTFLVDLRAPGVVVQPADELLGSRGLGTATVVFRGVRLDAAACAGQEGKGLRQILSVIDVGRLGIAGLALGVASAAVELAVARAAERHQFGAPLATRQGIQFLLAEMYARVAAVRASLYHAAALSDAGKPFALEAAVAKLLASEAAVRCAVDAVQIFGGDGYRRGSPVERLFRDAKGTQIYEGTSEIQRIVIARALLRETEAAASQDRAEVSSDRQKGAGEAAS